MPPNHDTPRCWNFTLDLSKVGLLRIGEAARKCGVGPTAVRRWMEEGQVEWVKLPNSFDHLEGAAYIHLHDSDNRILRLRGRAELVDNGCAPKLDPTTAIKPIVFDPTIQARMAVRNLKALVADFLPVHPDQRWIVISWLLSAFFLDLVRQRALLQISGKEGSGKSTVAEMLGCLLYGCSLDRSAAQAPSSLEAGNPLLSLDPPQNDRRLLLGLAQGIVRNPALVMFTGAGRGLALVMFTGAGRGFEGLSPWIFRRRSPP